MTDLCNDGGLFDSGIFKNGHVTVMIGMASWMKLYIGYR